MTQLTLTDAVYFFGRHEYGKADYVAQELLKHNPDNLSAWVLRGNILFAQYRSFDALVHYERVLMCKNDEWPSWVNKGACHVHLDQYDKAEHAFAKALEIKESYKVYVELMNLSALKMELERSLGYAEKALTFQDYDPDTLFMKSILLLGMGRWEEGYKLFKHRWDMSMLSNRRVLEYPSWSGETDKKVLVRVEQGYGDEILGIKFAKIKGIDTLLEVRPPFARLAKCLNQPLMVQGDDYPDDIGYATYGLDVPGIIGMKWQDVDRKPFFKVDRQWHMPLPEGFKVGLCWRTGAHLNDVSTIRRHKSLNINDFRPLIMDGVNLISLQKDAEPHSIPYDFPITDQVREIHDFEDTAALINSLDLVITVDTAVAHLAGALGKPVWNLVRFDGYWPWMDPQILPSSDYCIWYESMRLFRQERPLDWSGPLKRVISELSKLVETRR